MLRCLLSLFTSLPLILAQLPAPSSESPDLAGPPARARIPVLKDVTTESGLTQPGPSFKFGGPAVADINNDGIYDVFLTYHALNPLELFLGKSDGTFSPGNFKKDGDVHGVDVGFRTARSMNRLVTVSIGGGRGRSPKPFSSYEVDQKGQLENVTFDYGLGKGEGRPRAVFFMDLSLRSLRSRRRRGGGPDMLAVGVLGDEARGLKQYAYENKRGRYKFRRILGFENEQNGRVEVTDIDGDGVMEVISMLNFKIYKLVAPFKFEDRTEQIFPGRPAQLALRVSAVAELDYDNDGDFDLYVARINRRFITNRRKSPAEDIDDLLLQNRGGVYVDVAEEAGIPKGTRSIGVTAEDLNNDGFVDLVVLLWDEPDMILLNQGDGTFKRVDNLIPKARDTVGHNAVAVDYNRDGFVDVLVAHGNIADIEGRYFLMKNTLKAENAHYLHVRVGHCPRKAATSLHAVVTVIAGFKTFVRRVGSRGANYGGDSYIDTVHFGLGTLDEVDVVMVKWTSGTVRKKRDVPTNTLISFGKFG